MGFRTGEEQLVNHTHGDLKMNREERCNQAPVWGDGYY